MTAQDVLDSARERDVCVWADGPKLRWRSRGPLPGDLGDLLVAHKPGLLAILGASAPCPKCRRARDGKGRCWTCFDRPCVGCGRPTGSAFIATCFPCGNGVDSSGRDAGLRPDAEGDRPI